MSERGKYIVIEGVDATGKSLQVDRLVRKLSSLGLKSIQVHEPDGFEGDVELGLPKVEVSTELRKIIKNGNYHRDPVTNMLLFTTARRENWSQAMAPALKMGVWVVAARSWLSTVVYQGYGEGLDINEIGMTTSRFVGDKYAHPDLTMILTLNDEKIRSERISKRGELDNPDTFESKDEAFQRRINAGYLKYVSVWDESIPLIDASGTEDEVEKMIWQHVEPLTKERA